VTAILKSASLEDSSKDRSKVSSSKKASFTFCKPVKLWPCGGASLVAFAYLEALRVDLCSGGLWSGPGRSRGFPLFLGVLSIVRRNMIHWA